MKSNGVFIDGSDLRIGVAFTKFDKEKRTVTGVATADNVDKEGDIIDYAGSKEAFAKWMGNIREMHGSKAVGKAVDYREVDVIAKDGSTYKGFEVTSYISKGAQDTWEKILDGTLTGYSIGGTVLKKSREIHKGGKAVSRILKYALTELSVVDNPCNPLAEFSMVKSIGGGELEATDLLKADVDAEVIWYCDDHEIATLDTESCPIDGEPMFEIGFVESVEDFNPTNVAKMIEGYDLKKSRDGEVITTSAFSETGGGKDLHNNENTVNVEDMADLTPAQKKRFLSKMADFFFGGADEEVVAKFEGEHECDESCTEHTDVETNDTAEATAEAETKEISMENETVEETVEVEEVVAKAETVEETAEVEVKDEVVAEEITKVEDANEVLLEAIKKAVADTIGGAEYGWKADFSVFGSKLDDLTGNVERLSKRVEALEEAGAIKKSVDVDADIEDEVEVTETVTKTDSGWGNVFLPNSVITALGYES